jgi:hypothetical protein
MPEDHRARGPMLEVEGGHSEVDEEKATLEGMVKSHDELIMEIARETGLDRMGEDVRSRS